MSAVLVIVSGDARRIDRVIVEVEIGMVAEDVRGVGVRRGDVGSDCVVGPT